LASSDHGAAVMKLGKLVGAVAAEAGQSESAPVNLKDGKYVALCFLSGDDNIPHYVTGRIKVFTVGGPSNGAQAPSVVATIKAQDFSFVIPDNLKGTGTIAFVNRGLQPHGLALFKINPGATLDQVKSALLSNAPSSGPDPFTVAGGLPPIQPKRTEYLNFRLGTGQYVATCFVTYSKTGMPHAALGLLAPFTIS
jgi:hypothetical protein